MNTLCLELQDWDLFQDAAHNIALAKAPYALAQDVSSAIRTVLGEVWYDTSLGIDYFGQVLGRLPPISLLKAFMVNAALTVPNVISATCIIESFSLTTRELLGQVQFTDDLGNLGVVPLFARANVLQPTPQGQFLTTDDGTTITADDGTPIQVDGNTPVPTGNLATDDGSDILTDDGQVIEAE